MKRQDLRRYAFEISFGISVSADSPEEALERYLNSFQDTIEKENGKFGKGDIDFIRDLITGVCEHRPEIDEIIQRYAKGYDIKRISKVALSALRVSIYEILWREDIPNQVSVNEAVEIVKLYDDDSTKKFVNGILGSFLSETVS